MSRKYCPSKRPEAHTAIIGDVVAMWEKLAWDVDQYQDIQRSCPHEKQPLSFAAINACVAAWSLEQWAKAAWMKRERLADKKVSEKQFYGLIGPLVPAQAICASIANTAKHAEHHDHEHWKGGEVRLDWDDGDEDVPSGFILYHVGPNQTKAASAYSTFEDVRNDWWTCLVTLGLATGPQRSPEFMQNKLRRIFGNVVVPRLPSGASTTEKDLPETDVSES